MNKSGGQSPREREIIFCEVIACLRETYIMRALISVSDKTGVVDFARELVSLGWEILSTSGTMKMLKEAGLPVTSVSDVTGFPEICDGRVKTLHPKIHGALLARRDIPDHLKQLEDNGIEKIDLVCVNLYPFRETIAKPDVTMEDAVEHIDIGGPSMLRSAAKKYLPQLSPPCLLARGCQRMTKCHLAEKDH